MGIFNCFRSSGREKKGKGEKALITPSGNKNVKTLHVKLGHLNNCLETTEWKASSFSVPVPYSVMGNSTCKIKVINRDIRVANDSGEVDYEGGDEHDETLSMKRDISEFDLQARVGNSDEKNDYCSRSLDMSMNDIKLNSGTEQDMEMIDNGHISDPGTGKAELWASPKIKRSCSDLIMRSMCQELPPSEEVRRLAKRYGEGIFVGDATSPVSVMTHHTADKVMLKKHSSSQILPSRSRKLWWKLFLWSHRNLHRPQPVAIRPAFNQQGGYCSDNVEPRPAVESSKLGSPGSLSEELVDSGNGRRNTQCWDEFYGFSSMWPRNQWVAFPAESSPLGRVDEWVKEVSIQPSFSIEKDDDTVFPPSPENGLPQYPEEILHANSVIQSLNASSNVAHMTGNGLKVIPSMSHFCGLRSVNLSGNYIAHITPGSLPKSLHILNLSRNKINTIEGLRELTRLRVLDLSYNRISRIGQGLSSCTPIKELYLSGNKISYIEGLHRLLKLTVLDMSFNKITTTKALGQLVANYNSLISLNLLGNPIQSNISDEQLRKTICSLLTKLAFLNKQLVSPHKAREIGINAIAKAALGSSSRNTRRKSVKRVTQAGSSSSIARGGARKSRQRSRSRSRLHSAAKDRTNY